MNENLTKRTSKNNNILCNILIDNILSISIKRNKQFQPRLGYYRDVIGLQTF